MRKNLVFTPLMVLLAAGPSSPVHGQDLTSAVMAGRVTSQGGQPLRGVRVLVNSPAMLVQRETVTDANGQFRMPMLPSGAATVTYVLEGYITRRLTISLTAGQVSNANASMTPINMQEETVEIIGAIAQIDKTDTVVQVAFSNEKMNELMKAGDLTMAQVLVPAVAGNQLQGTPNIRGGTNRSTKVLYNGVPASDLFGGYIWSEDLNNVFLQDMIESFAVILSPSNARYGNSDGGMVSMVSRKGGNEYKGTMRVSDLSRDYWRFRNQPYPGRDGIVGGTTTAPSDVLRKRYEFTLEGPLWKDRLTFVYGGVLRPTNYWEWRPGQGIWGSTDNRNNAQYVGTFFQNQYGDIVRKSELGVFGDRSNLFYKSSNSAHNQFNLYAQITPNHQVEYMYKEATVNEYDYWGDLADARTEAAKGRVDNLHEVMRDWSIGYKGIIGSSGVLDFRYGKHYYATELPGAIGTRIVINRLPSYVPYSGPIGDANDYANFDNYWVNGFVNAAYDERIGGATTAFNAPANDLRDGGITTSTMLNYQHHLNARGSHIIDVGYQSDKLTWMTKIYAPWAQYIYTAPGMIATGLTEADVYRNPNNTAPITGTGINDRMPAAAMAGKYIVWNMRYATLGSIDPYGLQWAMDNRGPGVIAQDLPLYGSPIALNGRHLSNYYPRLQERYGNESGEYYTQMNSFYINDLWTLNDHHSVMVGIRFDMFKAWDTVKDVASYSLPTFRFEYKWDIYGDQSRLVNVNLSQYHNMAAANTFMPFVEARMVNRRDMYWDAGPTDGRPYLVGPEEFLNKSNYGLHYGGLEAGGTGSRIDPDWKAPMSTEFGISFARNFSGGGTFKVSYIQRSWTNLYDIYPGENFVTQQGTNQMVRVMKNTDDFERSYKGVEVEWNIPITRRLDFGGNYTHGRLMHNQTGIGTTATEIRSLDDVAYQMPEYWDQFWPRETWRPVTLANSEHFWNWWFIYDLSSGKTRSTLAIRGRYDTNGYGYRTVSEIVGVPEIPGITSAGYWTGTGLSRGMSIVNGKSKNDGDWNTTLRYNLTLPLYRKLSWFLTAEMTNPFNHRKRSPSGIVGFSMSQNRYIRDYTEPGTNGISFTKSDPYPNGLFRENGNVNGTYTGRQDGRVLILQTGLRF